MAEIKIELLVTPDGAEMFVPTAERIEKAKIRAKARIAEIERKAGEMRAAAKNPPKGSDPDELTAEAEALELEATAIAADVESTVRANEAIRERFGDKIQTITYQFRPYTDGEKSEALAECTDYSGMEPRLDRGRYHRRLAAVCTGLTESDILAFSPARAEAIMRECIDRSEPDPARLDFLF